VLASRGAVEGRVESARPLGSGELAELAVSLGSKLGKEVLLENVVVPTLVGGVRVFVAGKMIDYSVQGRLAGMRRKLMNARLPASSPA
jgi:F-type H+-transporting ATPase subunit delta